MKLLYHIDEIMSMTPEEIAQFERDKAAAFDEKPRPIRITHIWDQRKKLADHKAYYRKELARVHGEKCAYCGSANNLSVDHIYPISRGGCTTFDNLQLLCQPCNSKKKDKLPHEVGHVLYL